MKFNHLNIPPTWQHYWTKYPEGYTILEALLNWVNQVNSMVDNINDWNKYLDDFVQTFDTKLQITVTDILKEWQESGFLQVIIDEALETKMSYYINASMYSDLQTAIDTAIDGNKKLIIPSGTYIISDGITISKPIEIEGNGIDSTILDFSEMASGVALTIGTDSWLNAAKISGMTIKGNTNINGLKLNGSGLSTTPVTDSHFNDLRVEGCNVGMTGVYSWSNLFVNVRFHECIKPFDIGSQFNNTEFLRCSFTTFTDKMEFTNCEGIHFTSPNIANVSGSHAMELFQSYVSMDNAYIENIESDFAQIGRSSEAKNSIFTINGGKITDEQITILIAGQNSHVEVKNLDKPTYINQPNGDIAGGRTSPRLSVDHPLTKVPEYLINYNGESEFSFVNAYGGQTISTVFANGEVTITADLDSGESGYGGIRLSNKLVIGERYTLLYAIKSDDSVGLNNNQTGAIAVSALEEGYTLYAFPFIAQAATARLVWSTDYSITAKRIALVKGQYLV